MRDQHRPKQDLINEVIALRKQVADLREAMASRRRVEDALRRSEEQLRALADGSPVGLCLLLTCGGLLSANLPFARMLGYDSTAEPLNLGNALGVLASQEGQGLPEIFTEEGEFTARVLFRGKNGAPYASWVIGERYRDQAAAIGLVVLPEISAALSGGRRSA